MALQNIEFFIDMYTWVMLNIQHRGRRSCKRNGALYFCIALGMKTNMSTASEYVIIKPGQCSKFTGTIESRWRVVKLYSGSGWKNSSIHFFDNECDISTFILIDRLSE